MALNIKNAHVEQLAAEVAELAGESKTVAIGKALSERKERLLVNNGRAEGADRFARWLRTRYWPSLPDDARRGIPKSALEAILGIGPEGF